jgi:hypothetical protein
MNKQGSHEIVRRQNSAIPLLMRAFITAKFTSSINNLSFCDFHPKD